MNEREALIDAIYNNLREVTAIDHTSYHSFAFASLGYKYKKKYYDVPEDNFLEVVKDMELVLDNRSANFNDPFHKYIGYAYISDNSFIVTDYSTLAGDGSVLFAGVYVYSKEPEEFPFIRKSKDDRTIEIKISDGNSVFSFSRPPKYENLDLDIHYNDSIHEVDSAMKEFLEEEKSGAVILRGEAGTGKTNYILWLAANTDYKFIFIDASAIRLISMGREIINHSESKNTIFVFEDCESILQDRATNPDKDITAEYLSLLDGAFGKMFRVKMIFTSNLSEKKIDPAFLRPGRTFGIFNFDKLSEDKVKKINPNLSGEMTLAEIFNQKYDNEPVKKIGF